MAIKQLNVSFECLDVGEGLSLSDLASALLGVQRAVRNMVEYMAGVEPPQGRRPLGWTRRESVLSLRSLSVDSLVAELILQSSMNAQSPYADGRDYGSEAIDAILDWNNNEGSNHLPYEVSNALMGIYDKLSTNVSKVSLYTPQDERLMSIPRDSDRETEVHYEETVVQGYLMEIDWARNTARLDRHGDESVPLEFDDKLNGDMQRFAKQFIKVNGSGTLNVTDDKWVNVKVEKIIGDRSPYEPFGLGELDRNPKVFRSGDMRHVALFESDEELNDFIRVIRESRNR